MKTRHIRRGDTQSIRWKNGAGSARCIWREPGEGGEEPCWELAIAEMTGSQPFSFYPGIDRSLFVLRGMMRVTSPVRDLTLTPESPALMFAGEEAVQGHAPPGVVMEDFNILTRRNICTHEAVRWRGKIKIRLTVGAGWTVLYAQEGIMRVHGAAKATLEPGDTLILQGSQGEACTLQVEAEAGTIGISAAILPV